MSASVHNIADHQNDQGVIDAALEIAREWDKNVDLLCEAVLSGDYTTAKLLAKELKNDEESN